MASVDQNVRVDSFTRQYISELKNKLGIESDYALAKHLRVSKTTVSNYTNGYSHFSPAVCHRAAEILGIHAAVIFAAMEVDRHHGVQEEIDTWAFIHEATRKAAMRLQMGVANVSLVLAFAIVLGATYAPPVRAAAVEAFGASNSLYIMLNFKCDVAGPD